MDAKLGTIIRINYKFTIKYIQIPNQKLKRCIYLNPKLLMSAPWLFMGHCARFLSCTGVDLICYLDDVGVSPLGPRGLAVSPT